jgi:hypothetical protein
MYLVGGTICNPNTPHGGIVQDNNDLPVIYNVSPKASQPDADGTAPAVAKTTVPWQSYLQDLIAAQNSGNFGASYRVYDDWNWQWDWNEANPEESSIPTEMPDLNVFSYYSPVQGIQRGVAGSPLAGVQDDPNYFAANYSANAAGVPGDSRLLFAQHINPLDGSAGTLATVTWICPPYEYSEHPGSISTWKSADGARYIAQIVDALINSEFWSTTVLVICYDETDTHFDHVVPPFSPNPPSGNDEPWIDDPNLGYAAPIGAGMRVPAIIVSPWTYRAGVIDDFLDHTSILRLMESVTGVQCSTLPQTGWRQEQFSNLSDVIENLNTPPDPASQIQADQLQLGGLPTSQTVVQWQANAEARFNAGKPAPTPPQPQPPPVAQSCSANDPSLDGSVVITEFGKEQAGQSPQPGGLGTATIQNALTVVVNGFEPDEFIDLHSGIPNWIPQSQRNPPVPSLPLQGGGSCDMRVPVITAVVGGGASPGELSFQCTQVNFNPNSPAAQASQAQNQGVPQQITFMFSVTFNTPITSFAFRRGTARIIDLQVSFEVDATVTASAQLTLTGGTLIPVNLDFCANLAEQITQAEQAVLAAMKAAPRSPDGAAQVTAASVALGVLQAQYTKYCGSGGSSGPSQPGVPVRGGGGPTGEGDPTGGHDKVAEGPTG